MVKWKQILSVLTAATVLMAMLVVVNMPTLAQDSGETHLEAEKYGEGNIFEIGDSSNFSGGKAYNIYNSMGDAIQSEEEINSGLDRSKTPFVQFILDARQDGSYELMVRLRHITYGGVTAKPAVWMLVNDSPAEKITVSTAVGGGADGECLAITAALKKGRNVIRFTGLTDDFITLVKQDGKQKNRYIAVDYMDVPAGVVGVLPQTERLAANAAADSKYYKNISPSDKSVDFWGLNYSKVGTITPETLRVRNLDNVPYFSMTVNVPEDGYYNITPTVRYGTDVPVSMGVLIDGVNPANRPKLPSTGGSWRGTADDGGAVAEYTVYLTQGEHVIVFTGLLSPKQNTDSPIANFFYVFLRGGMTLAAKQEDPMKFDTSYTHLEAEKYGEGNIFEIGDSSNFSDGKAYNIYNSMGDAIQTEEEINSGLDRSKTPFVQFILDARQDGSYELMARFRHINNGGVTAKPAVWMLINDAPAEKITVNTAVGGGADGECLVITAVLKKGRNVVRFTGLTDDFIALVKQDGQQPNHYIAVDYLEVPEGITGVLPQTERLDAIAAASSGYFNNMTPSADGNSDFWGVNYGGVTSETADSIQMRNLSALPYFALTLEVPADGYYNLAPTVRYSADQPLKMGIFIDSVNPSGKPKLPSTGGVVKGNANGGVEADYVVYLTKGRHIITFTGLLSPKQETGGKITNFYHVMLRGGVKLGDEQIDPFDAGFTRVEAETALANMMKRGGSSWSGYSGGAANSDPVMNVAQTLSEIRKNGIDNNRTAYTLYTVYAPEDGTYTVNARVRYGVYGVNKTQYYDKTAHIVVMANDDAENMGVIDIPILSTRENAIIWDEVSIKLKKGENKIRVTGFTADLTDRNGKEFLWNNVEEGFFWLDQDYIAVPEGVTASGPMGGRIEAEESLFSYYTHDLFNNSGGFVGLRDENNTQNSINYDITYDSLNGDNMSYIHFVHYRVIAPADGMYDVSIALRARDTYGDNTLDLSKFVGYVAVMVNTEDKYKVDFTLGYRTIYTRLYLKEGINTVSVSGNVREMLDSSVDPVNISLRIDQDYLDLGPGLTAYSEGYSNPGTDDVATPLINAKAGNKDASSGDSPTTGDNSSLPLCLGVAAASGAAAMLSKRKLSKKKS